MDKGLLRAVLLFIALALSEGRVVKVPVGPLVHVEGQPVSIRCDVSNYEGPRDQDFEWYLMMADKMLPLVSTFDGLFTDSSMKDRVNSRDISFVKLSDSSVELKFKSVRATDSGVYRCSTPSTDSVISGNYYADVELKVIGDSLKVSPLIPKAAVSAGESVELQCNTTRGFTEHTFLSVSWSVRRANNSGVLEQILTFGPDDKIQTGSNYTQRYVDGGLLLDLRGGGFYGLVLKAATPADRGKYVCTAQEWVRQGHTWRKILERSEDMGKVEVTATDLQYALSLAVSVSPQSAGEPTELRCQVQQLLYLQNGRLGVSWVYSTRGAAAEVQAEVMVASLDQQGALTAGAQYQQRLDRGDIALTRTPDNTFILRILQIADADMGWYSCRVTAWTLDRKGGWTISKEVQSSPVAVQWTPKTPGLSVAAHRVREASSAGSTFEMTCQVSGQNLQDSSYSVLIRFEESGAGGKSRKVLSLSPDSVLQLEEWSEPGRIDSVVLEKSGATEYRFRLYGAQVSDRGFYCCDVTAWTRHQSQDWTKIISAVSSKIQIDFVHTGPVFNISIHSDANDVSLGDTVQMKCSVSILNASPNTGDVAFEVRWFQSSMHPLDNGVSPLISMDRYGVVKKSSSNDSSLERTDQYSFTLSLHSVQHTDVGEYYCRATPWLLSPATGAWGKETELSSGRVLLAVRTEMWESLKMPVGYGVIAALVAGLLSILLGLAVARCCFSRNPLHTPRPHNKLMDLEMD